MFREIENASLHVLEPNNSVDYKFLLVAVVIMEQTICCHD